MALTKRATQQNRTLIAILAAILLQFLFLFALDAHAAPKEVLISISIDYEGEIIKRENIEAILAFRRQHPEVRIIHFLNAASFTVEGADTEETIRLMKSVINPEIDELGLHIHSRKSLVQASGVHFRVEPAYLGDADPKYIANAQKYNLMPWQEPRPQTLPSTGKFGELGDDVPFWAYTEVEQRKIIRASLDILARHGFTGLKSFRAGGWSASPETWRALVAEGIQIDSSAVPADIIAAQYSKSYLIHFNKQIWKGIDKTSQPYKINLGESEIMQFPNNGGLADYQSAEEFFNSFVATIQRHASAEKAVVHIGFHLESAAKYLNNVVGGYELMANYAAKKNIKLTSATFQSAQSSGVLATPKLNRNIERACRSLFSY